MLTSGRQPDTTSSTGMPFSGHIPLGVAILPAAIAGAFTPTTLDEAIRTALFGGSRSHGGPLVARPSDCTQLAADSAVRRAGGGSEPWLRDVRPWAMSTWGVTLEG